MTNEEAVKMLRTMQRTVYLGNRKFEDAIECAIKALSEPLQPWEVLVAQAVLPQPDIVRCKDCKWWDRYNDNNGYCMAAKSCTYTSHWDIQIRRTYDGDFYCAHAEPKEEYEEDDDE